MARVDTRMQKTSVKSKSANICKFLLIIALTTLVAAAYFLSKGPLDGLGDPSDQFVIKNIPKSYQRLEGIDPEEREVFHGFQTSFLPPEEIILSRRELDNREETYEGNSTSDIFIWGIEGKKRSVPTRVKRKSHFTFSSHDYDEKDLTENKSVEEEKHLEEYVTKEKEDYESTSQEEHDEEGNLESVIHPEIYVDRGPLDDVEQTRRQPELEEAEMGSAAHVYKSVRSYTGHCPRGHYNSQARTQLYQMDKRQIYYSIDYRPEISQVHA